MEGGREGGRERRKTRNVLCVKKVWILLYRDLQYSTVVYSEITNTE